MASNSRITRTTRSMSFKTRPSAFNANVTLYEPVSDLSDLSQEHDTDGPAPRKRQKTDASAPRNVVRREISPKKRKPIPQALANRHPAPEKWGEVYDTIKGMRSRMTAPVYTMGFDQAQHKESDPKVRLN
jgi:endonuclease-3